MPIEILSEKDNRVTFDERSTNLGELRDLAQRKWPTTSIEEIVFSPMVYGFENNTFALTIRRSILDRFRSDGQLTLSAFVTLGQAIRTVAGQNHPIDLERVALCWNLGTLHLNESTK